MLTALNTSKILPQLIVADELPPQKTCYEKSRGRTLKFLRGL